MKLTLERTTDTIKKWGRPCERVEVRALDAKGEEKGFAWAEQSWQSPDMWSAYRWSDNVGPVLLSGWRTKEDAIAVCEAHVG
jgi:hypothetical protein